MAMSLLLGSQGTLSLGIQLPCCEEVQDPRRGHTEVFWPIASGELVLIARHVWEDTSG